MYRTEAGNLVTMDSTTLCIVSDAVFYVDMFTNLLIHALYHSQAQELFHHQLCLHLSYD